MIKVEDLMVGNLVKVIGTESVFTDGEICSVESVDRIYGVASLKGIDWGVEECGFLKNIREIDPIPLTPEILERNGFEMREDTVVYAKNRIALKPSDDEKGYQVGLGSLRLFYVKVSVIKYVHELQNILYWIKGENANLTI
nr:MAG TPA: hypothetical protein [Caudoviricetes sp.]